MESIETDKQEANWVPVAPIPRGTPRPDTTHPNFGKPATVKTFKDEAGAYMAAFKFRVGDAYAYDGLSLWRASSGETEWRWAVLPKANQSTQGALAGGLCDTAPLFQQGVKVNPRRLECRYRAKQRGRYQCQQQTEEQHAVIDADMLKELRQTPGG